MACKSGWKQAICNLIFLFLIVMCGCGKVVHDIKEERNVTKIIPEDYKSISFVMDITPKYCPDPFLFAMTDAFVYFCETERMESAESISYKYAFYKCSIVSGEKSELISAGTERVLSFFAGNDNQLSILTMNDGSCFFKSFDFNGNLLREIKVMDQEFCESYVTWHCQASDGGYYAMNKKTLFYINSEGKCSMSVACPGNGFLCGSIADDGELFVTFQGRKPQEHYLARLDRKSGEFTEKESVGAKVSMMTDGGAGSLLLLQPDGVECYSRLEKSVSHWLSFDDFAGISADRIRTIDYSNNQLRMISWKGAKRTMSVELITFQRMTQEEKELREERMADGSRDSLGREKIVICDLTGMGASMLQNVISDFNAENKNYFVQLEGATADLNARLASSNCPDILYLNQSNEVSNYSQKGYLEDLVPYLSESQHMSTDDFYEFALSGFMQAGALYAIPCKLEILSLFGMAEGVGDEEGWTVDEFMAWLDEAEEISSYERLSKQNVLRSCLMGSLEEWIDLEKKVVNLNTDTFKSLLMGIWNYDDSKAKASSRLGQQDGKNRLVNNPIASVRDLAMDELFCNGTIIHKGFPNKDGLAKCYVNTKDIFCIASNSNHKDGAFEFMEYALRHPKEDMIDSLGNVKSYGGGIIWSQKEMFHLEAEGALGELVMAFPTQIVPGEQQTEMTYITLKITSQHMKITEALLRNARLDTKEMQTIREIILEEAEAYFLGQISLERLCDIIQERVQLFVDENSI